MANIYLLSERPTTRLADMLRLRHAFLKTLRWRAHSRRQAGESGSATGPMPSAPACTETSTNSAMAGRRIWRCCFRGPDGWQRKRLFGGRFHLRIFSYRCLPPQSFIVGGGLYREGWHLRATRYGCAAPTLTWQWSCWVRYLACRFSPIYCCVRSERTREAASPGRGARTRKNL